ncbi:MULTISPECIES: hypothetical protein [Mammaliicoccus]|uniref:hypothetical protein n=1 Tax=Mammaliicoccus TaxID=2803850 RepID=UPI000D1F42A2|nr:MULTISPECIES: hypothetical protein [Mammaliicoccus]MEB5758403.1 hypothetical protein [Mammaliicoccus sciuri]PTJ46889.1 hypothetical protein BUZ98_02630 [Mammaliicoccus sciuri]PTJ51813.1 hypothetical protein BU012_06125 [Mammaliicoccus sciuri]PTJ61974.1 hypothetical protein BU009_00400 [Mammaliicoccus sciuri]PTJ64939.1 hypothetical protein BUZ97_02925 [Mammaliicoccus sciuri]
MKNLIWIILGLCSLAYSINLFYNAIFNNKPLNPVTTIILIFVIFYIVYALISDKHKKPKSNNN